MIGELTKDEMAALLEASGDFRVLRKLVRRPTVAEPREGYPYRGLLVDGETTGLNHSIDTLIEIGAILFSFNAEGLIGDVLATFEGLQQPAAPIPEEIVSLTGITDEMLEGQTFQIDALEEMAKQADLIIAHNAAFDRPFFEVVSPAFWKAAWACSDSEVDWRARGYEGKKLAYLVSQAGLFFTGHRALDDCFALLEVLDRKGDASSAFTELYIASQRELARIFATNTPFDLKDKLKARSYRWNDGSNGRPKSWWIEVPAADEDAELEFLRTEIYGHEGDILIKHVTAFDRFRTA